MDDTVKVLYSETRLTDGDFIDLEVVIATQSVGEFFTITMDRGRLELLPDEAKVLHEMLGRALAGMDSWGR
jgi:hypothetical protein